MADSHVIDSPVLPLKWPAWLHPAALPVALRGWVLPALLLGLWWAAFRFHWVHSPLFVSPGAVAARALELFAGIEFWQALGASLARDLAGFAAGALAGFALGTALGSSRALESLIAPTFHTLKQVSIFAWVPLISLWFGLGDTAKIAFIGLSAFWPALLNTFDGVRAVPREYVEVARVFAYSRSQLIARVVLPAALPAIFSGVYLALIYSWLSALGAEYLLTSGIGIGNLLTEGQENFRMADVLLGVGVVGLVGFLLNWLAGRLETRLLKWRVR
jgi:sulfonate transport system permease protein